jgi:hypothetical protein
MSNIFNFFNDDSDDEEDKITFTWPECREQILNKTGIFNKILDRDICKLVADVKDCEAKREWQIRRNDYLNNNKTKKEKKNDNEKTDNEIDSYQQIFDKFIPIIAISIMIIIYLSRK